MNTNRIAKKVVQRALRNVNASSRYNRGSSRSYTKGFDNEDINNEWQLMVNNAANAVKLTRDLVAITEKIAKNYENIVSIVEDNELTTYENLLSKTQAWMDTLNDTSTEALDDYIQFRDFTTEY